MKESCGTQPQVEMKFLVSSSNTVIKHLPHGVVMQGQADGHGENKTYAERRVYISRVTALDSRKCTSKKLVSAESDDTKATTEEFAGSYHSESHQQTATAEDSTLLAAQVAAIMEVVDDQLHAAGLNPSHRLVVRAVEFRGSLL